MDQDSVESYIPPIKVWDVPESEEGEDDCTIITERRSGIIDLPTSESEIEEDEDPTHDKGMPIIDLNQ